MASVQMSTIANGFSESGICLFNFQVIPAIKLAPSLPYTSAKPDLKPQVLSNEHNFL